MTGDAAAPMPVLRTARLVATPVEAALRGSVEHARRHGFGRWMLRHDDEPVGALKLAVCTIAGRDEVELGYALLPGHWGKGYATEAASAGLSFAADDLRLPSVVAFALTTNAASLAVMDRLGFVHERVVELPEGPHDVRRRRLG